MQRLSQYAFGRVRVASRWRWAAGAILVALSGALLGGAFPAQATSGINQQINYQARLLNSSGATVPDGNYNIEFKIYSGGTGCVSSGSSPCGGTLLWTEDWLNHSSQGVVVTNGYFSVMLGAGADSASLDSAVNFNQTPLWLSIAIGGTSTSCTTFSGCGGDTEMLPFTQFAAAPYAFDAEAVGGVAASGLAQLSASQTLTGANVLQPTTNITGAVIKQTSASSPTADIFDVQTANGSSIIQATGPSANNSAVSLASVGAGNALSLTGAGALTLSGGAASTWDVNGTLSLQTANNGAITTGTGTLTAGGKLVVQGAGNAVTLSAAPTASATQSLLDLGSAIASGSSSGTFIGVNAANGYSGDLINVELNGTSEFLVSAAGDVRQGGGVNIYNTGSNAPGPYLGTATLTVSDLLNERFVAGDNTSGVAGTLTTPSAASLVAAIPHAAVGDSFVFTISNGGGKVFSLAGGTNVTMNAAVASIPSNSTSTFLCRLTNVTGGSQAITCY